MIQTEINPVNSTRENNPKNVPEMTMIKETNSRMKDKSKSVWTGGFRSGRTDSPERLRRERELKEGKCQKKAREEKTQTDVPGTTKSHKWPDERQVQVRMDRRLQKREDRLA